MPTSAHFFSIHLTTTYCLVYRSDINNEVILFTHTHQHIDIRLAHTQLTHILFFSRERLMYTFNTAHTYQHKDTHARRTHTPYMRCAHLASISTHLIRVSLWLDERGWCFFFAFRFHANGSDWSSHACWHCWFKGGIPCESTFQSKREIYLLRDGHFIWIYSSKKREIISNFIFYFIFLSLNRISYCLKQKKHLSTRLHSKRLLFLQFILEFYRKWCTTAASLFSFRIVDYAKPRFN